MVPGDVPLPLPSDLEHRDAMTDHDLFVHVDVAAAAYRVERERADELRAAMRLLALYAANKCDLPSCYGDDPVAFIHAVLEQDAQRDNADDLEPGVCEVCGPAPIAVHGILAAPPACVWCGSPP